MTLLACDVTKMDVFFFEEGIVLYLYCPIVGKRHEFWYAYILLGLNCNKRLPSLGGALGHIHVSDQDFQNINEGGCIHTGLEYWTGLLD